MKEWALGFISVAPMIVASCTTADRADDHLIPPPDEAAIVATCEGFGPQTPRDIDNRRGQNPIVSSFAPDYERMNLCNIHFHKSAEHRSKAFAIPAENSDGGFRCAISETLTAAELRRPATDVCSGLQPGDTIEVHWVYSSCDVAPGEGLGACLNDTCANPDLRVETQVFTLVNDPSALDFTDFGYTGSRTGVYHQAASLPTGTGTPVTFLGSTTGPSYSNEQCSPLQVSWSVRPECARLDINSLGTWCLSNPFMEDHAHGVRELVTDPALLAPIR
ncbi:MAG: cadmium carbonic anhydrase [Acidobacteria bacterium]|nr:cadmium carbonic anhydrase [Acidobacteriota bacterium]